MLPKTFTISALIFATGSTLAIPGAIADSGDFWSQLNSTDGGANVFAHVPERPKAPATPEQAANLRFLESQRRISDGSGQWSGGSEPGESHGAPSARMQARGAGGESAQ